MPVLNNNIEIGRNCLSYYDEVIKISNISRSYIFQFHNRERKAFDDEVAAYNTAKRFYESVEHYKKKSNTRNLIITAIILLLVCAVLLFWKIYWGLILLVFIGICGILAYITVKKDITYPVPPPVARPFPDKYGLKIEMNSGNCVYFTAVENEGLQSLRNLQHDIYDEDTQQGITIFNMNDNHVSVENNEGIVSTGNQANNNVAYNNEKELLHI